MDIGAREEGHVYMGMTALAGIIGADPAAGAWGYHLHDHLGSTRRIHNQANLVVAGLLTAPRCGARNL